MKINLSEHLRLQGLTNNVLEAKIQEYPNNLAMREEQNYQRNRYLPDTQENKSLSIQESTTSPT